MPMRIRVSGPPHKRIVDTSAMPPRLEPSAIAAALGAEPSGSGLEAALAPITLFAVRSELFRRLQSGGGLPELAGASKRAKFPIADFEWVELERLASAISEPGLQPTAGQVASVILGLSVRTIASQVERNPGASPLAHDLATRSIIAPV